MKAVDVRPARGDFGLSEARIIKPRDPYSSTLFYRMEKFGRDRMPHIGSEIPDEAGLELIQKWIEGMPGDDDWPMPRTIQVLARQIGRGEIPPGAERDAVLARMIKRLRGLQTARPRAVRRLPAFGWQGGPQARLKSPTKNDISVKGRRRPRRETLLVASGQLRQLPQNRRKRHAHRP